MAAAKRHLGVRAGVLFLLLALAAPAFGFPTGTPLTLTIDPGTIRQKTGKETAKAMATVQLKEPSPAYFVCVLRSADGTKINFPAIIFHKGEQKGSSEGVVDWKQLRHESRVHISAYNADAPDQRLTFTVTLVPAQDVTNASL